MKAAVFFQYGPPEVVQIMDTKKPVPKSNELLIKVHSTTLNRTDCGFRKPEYFIVRLVGGLFKPRHTVLGTELAGVVEEIGEKVTRFRVGDEVFGLSTLRFGAHAEYIVIPETGSIAIKPANTSFNEAAAVCDGLMLAYNYIKRIKFNASTSILINGASGSIGSAGVQLAKYYGAKVTAVCSTKSMELIKSLGADEVIDYTKTDFTLCEQKFDVVFDAVGKSTFFKSRKILKPAGVYFSSELGPWSQNVWLALFHGSIGKIPVFNRLKKVKFPIPTDNQKDIEFYKFLMETGKYRAVIDRVYPLDNIVEAIRYVETGEKTGNVVIEVSQ